MGDGSLPQNGPPEALGVVGLVGGTLGGAGSAVVADPADDQLVLGAEPD